jgi:hypothetical protein
VQAAAVVVVMVEIALVKVGRAVVVVEVGQTLQDIALMAQQEPQTLGVEAVVEVIRILPMVYFLVEAVAQAL